MKTQILVLCIRDGPYTKTGDTQHMCTFDFFISNVDYKLDYKIKFEELDIFSGGIAIQFRWTRVKTIRVAESRSFPQWSGRNFGLEAIIYFCNVKLSKIMYIHIYKISTEMHQSRSYTSSQRRHQKITLKRKSLNANPNINLFHSCMGGCLLRKENTHTADKISILKGTINRHDQQGIWNRSASFISTWWLKIIPHMIRSYYRWCCIN